MKISNSTQTIVSNISVTESKIQNSDIVDTNDSILGYKVDKDGYFTNEFNKAAGIPDDYKIHSDTIKSLVNVRTNKGDFTRSFKAIDIAKTVGNAYKVLTQLVDEKTLNSKESFTTDEISKFTQGYEYDKKTLKITKKYDTINAYMSARSDFDPRMAQNKDKTMTTTFYNRSTINYYTNGNKLKPSTDIFDSNSGGKEDLPSGINFNTTRDKYTNNDGSITKGGLLIGILNKNLNVVEGETTYFGILDGFDKNISPNDYMAQIQLWLLNHDPDRVSDEEKLQERAQKARLEQRKAMQQNLGTQTIKNVAQTSKDTLNEMLEFLSKMSKQHGVNLDINEVKTAFINLTDSYKFNNKTIDIKA